MRAPGFSLLDMTPPRLIPTYIAVGALLATDARAEQRQAPPSASDSAAECPRGRGSALGELTCEIVFHLEGVPSPAVVVSAPLTSDRPAPRGSELATALARLIAGSLGARSSNAPATLARARHLAGEAGTLVHLVPNLQAGTLTVTADVYDVPRSFWDRIREPEPHPTRHGFASRRIDAEIAAYLPAVPLVASRVDKAAAPSHDTTALACGDLNGDGALEIAVVGRHRIELGRLRGGAFQSHASREWKTLSPVAPAPLREPIGAATIREGAYLDAGNTDRARGFRLDAELAPVSPLAAPVPWAEVGCLSVIDLGLGSVQPCDAEPPAIGVPVEEPADAVAGARLVDAGGRAYTVVAWRALGAAIVTLRDDRGRQATVEGLGAQLAIADLDGDGRPEIVAGADTLDPAGDALIVHTWSRDGNVDERFRLAVPAGVRAVAVCPAEEGPLAPIVVATGDEVWVVR